MAALPTNATPSSFLFLEGGYKSEPQAVRFTQKPTPQKPHIIHHGRDQQPKLSTLTLPDQIFPRLLQPLRDGEIWRAFNSNEFQVCRQYQPQA